MNRAKFTLGLILFTASLAFAADAPTNQVAFEGLYQSKTGPVFDNGYVVGWDQTNWHSMALYAPDGHQLYETVLKIPGAPDEPSIPATAVGVAIDTDGTMAVAYATPTQEDLGPRFGIAFLDKSGSLIRAIPTKPYVPSALCFAPDHSLWVYGSLYPESSTDFLVFRKYSREGKELGAFVPRSKFPAWESAGLDQLANGILGCWMLRATKDRIGAILRPGINKRTWVELDMDGNLLHQWTYTGNDQEFIEPAAFTDDDVLYGNRFVTENPHAVSSEVFDKTTGTWTPVPSLPRKRLLSADGNRLVYLSNHDQLIWLP